MADAHESVSAIYGDLLKAHLRAYERPICWLLHGCEPWELPNPNPFRKVTLFPRLERIHEVVTGFWREACKRTMAAWETLRHGVREYD